MNEKLFVLASQKKTTNHILLSFSEDDCTN